MKPRQSIEAAAAYEELRKLAVGEICPYSTLAAAICRNPQRDGYGYVLTARRRIEHDFDCVLEAVANVGIKRLPPRETINRGVRDLRHIRRSIKRGRRRQTTLVPVENHGGLTSEERGRYLVNLSHLGVLEYVTRPQQRRALEAAVNSKAGPIPIGDTLSMFTGRAQKKLAATTEKSDAAAN